MGVENEMFFKKVIEVAGLRFGIQHDLVHIDGDPYLERWILWFGYQIRLHKFFRGDKDRALHDHPWSFITFPLKAYAEVYWDGQREARRVVEAWRFHFRPAEHRHIVKQIWKRPFYTIILCGLKRNEWGFWPDPQTFVHWRDWVE
jgi:hypothetical protein